MTLKTQEEKISSILTRSLGSLRLERKGGTLTNVNFLILSLRRVNQGL